MRIPSLTAALGSNDDVDVFWLGELAPNWKLELTAAGRSVVAKERLPAVHNDVTAPVVPIQQRHEGRGYVGRLGRR